MTFDWTGWLLSPASPLLRDVPEPLRLALQSVQHRRAGDLDKAWKSALAAYAMVRDEPAGYQSKAAVEYTLASLYKAQADYGVAIDLYESSYRGHLRADGAASPFAEIVLRGMADAHHKAGHYDKALDACLRALEMTRDVRDVRYAFGCQLLARIRSDVGDIAGAAKAVEEANAVLAKVRGNSPDTALLYAANISQGAAIQVREGDVRDGVARQRQALKLRRRYGRSNGTAIAESLSHLGHAALAVGRHRRARRYLRRALAMHRRQGEHADKARQVIDRMAYGHAGFLLGRKSAETELAAVVADAGVILGESHRITTRAMTSLASVHAAAGRSADALALLSAAVDGENKRIGPIFTTQSDRQRLEYVATLYGARDAALSMLVRDHDLGPDAVAAVLRIVVQRSGLTLDAVVRQRRSVLSGGHPDLSADLGRLREVDESLATATFGATPPPYRTVRAWEQERDRLEARLSSRIPELRRDHDLVTVTVERLAAALPADSLLLQYVRFDHSDDPRRPAREWYGAFALAAGRPESVRFASLGPADDLDAMVDAYRTAIAPRGGRGVRISAAAPPQDWRPLAAELYRAVIAPLNPPPVSRLVVVADGSLHRIPLATLIGPRGTPLVADTILTYLGSARDLLQDRPPAHEGTALVIADPDYGDYGDRRRRAALKPVFHALPGGAEEGRKVAERLGTIAVSGPKASKSVLFTDEPPTVVHLATHGFWLGGLAGSGLALTGANLPGGDGILTTAEIAHLNLTGTGLVVLSACDTGIGAVRDAEGVFGLHRAFTIAGARTVISSLWPIPDRATAELMTAFYDSLRDGEPAAALTRTQAAFAADDRPIREWGAFLCHGGLPSPEDHR
ncbi:tetratricopeptide repeat protein [Actinoallomurus acanthiterrae]